MLAEKLSGGAAADVTYVDDVFSSWLRTGTGADVTTTTNIDMTKGYMIWTKGRSGATDHAIYDSARGVTYDLASNTTAAQTTQSTGLKSVSSTGYTIGSLAKMNTSSATYVDWTFRKAAKFFDVVTYTGTGSARTIAHSLGSAPGCIIVKRIDTAGNWQVYHNGLTSAAYSIQLNLTSAQASATTVWNSTAPTSSGFSVGTDATVNASGATYVAYLFAHDAGGFGLTGTDNVISCGSYTGNGSASGPTITLGYEPQYLMIKNASGTGNWQIIDSMRGMPVGSADAELQANLANAESSADYVSPNATGFQIVSTSTEVNTSASTYIYIAIRRPNKPPTSGTQVYNAVTYTAVASTAYTHGLSSIDVFVQKRRDSAQTGLWYDRMRGGVLRLLPSDTTIEVSDANSWANLWDRQGSIVSAASLGSEWQSSQVGWAFKRAPGFMDVVAYTGTGSGSHPVSHNLQAVPQLVFIKQRSGASSWTGYVDKFDGDYNVFADLLFTTSQPNYSTSKASLGITSASIYTDASLLGSSNASGQTYIAYLFASLPGISKVGSYTGNGTSQTINCGFSAGARFILIKRTDSTGDWKVIDSARGIVAGNDPTLALNSTAAEVTGTDCIDPDSSGFIVNQESTNNLNVNGATYIFLSVS